MPGSRDFARRPGLRAFTKDEARGVQPPGADPGMREDAPVPLRHFWVRTEGEPDAHRPSGVQLHHVGASGEQEARDIVGHIEETNATGINGHGGEPWKITDIADATAAVDPDTQNLVTP